MASITLSDLIAEGAEPATNAAKKKTITLSELQADSSGSNRAATDAQGMSASEKFWAGVRDPISGAAQLLTKALPDRAVRAGNDLNNWLADKTGVVARLPEGGVDRMVRDQESAYQAKRAAAGESGFDAWRVAGNVMSPANLAIAARLPVAATLAGRVGAGMASGGASGLMNPVTEGENFATEKAKQAGLGAAFGGAMPAITGALARLVSPNASTNANLALLKAEGVRPTVGQSLGGRMNTVEEKAMSIPLVGDMIANARTNSLKQFNEAAINRAASPVGQRVEGFGQGAVKEAGDAISKVYDDALNQIKAVRFDAQFGQDLNQLRGMASNLVTSGGLREKFNDVVQNIVMARMSPNGAMLGETYKQVDSEIGHLAARYQKSPVASESELGDAFAQLQALLKQQAMRSNPKAAELLGQADEAWANLVRIEGASKAGKNAEGLFTPAQLNAAIQQADKSTRKRAVSRGDALMQDLGNAGQQVLGNKVPDSGTAGRIGAGLGLLGGSYMFNPALAAGLLGGAAAYSAPMQRMLAGAVSARPELAQAVAEAMRKASPGLIPAGAQFGLGLLN